MFKVMVYGGQMLKNLTLNIYGVDDTETRNDNKVCCDMNYDLTFLILYA